MKVIVLGAGVIGTTTAYQLAKAGHEVVVVDRQTGPALETSFANAGEVSTQLRTTSQEVAFGQTSPEDAGPAFFEQASATLARAKKG